MQFLSVLVIMFSFTNLACGLFIPQRVYLIPDGIEGEVYIFRGVVRGENFETNGNSTIFRIPNSRFLISKYVPDESAYTSGFYYVKADGSKSQLEVEYSSLHRTEENLTNKQPFVWAPVNVSSSWSKIQCEVKYERFYVGTRPHMLSKTQLDRDNEWFRFQEFVEANADLLCKDKPNVQTTFPKKADD
jgi:hypothetical protein